jgi:hypothetical protein
MWNKLRELTLQELKDAVRANEGDEAADIMKSCKYTKDVEFGAGGIIKAAEYVCSCWDEDFRRERETRVFAYYAWDEAAGEDKIVATHCAEDWQGF